MIGLNKKIIENDKNNVLGLLFDDSGKKNIISAEEYCISRIIDIFNPVALHSSRDNVEIWVKIDGVYRNEGITKIDEYVGDVYDIYYDTNIKKRIFTKLKSRIYEDSKDFFDIKNPLYVPLKNGVYDLSKNKLFKYEEVDSRFFSKLKVEYNPNAGQPKKIIRFLKQVLKYGDDDIVSMQEILGNILLGDYRFQQAVMLIGNGSNGKSVFLNTIQALFKGVCSNLDLSEVNKKKNDNFELELLVGKWLNVGGEIGEKDLKDDTTTFKKLTGEDYIVAKRKMKDAIIFKNRAKMFFACNSLPIPNDDSGGFFRRWSIFEFDKKFTKTYLEPNGEEITEIIMNTYEQDPDIIKKLTTKQELEALLLWLIDGCNRLLINKGFSYSPSNKEIKEKWNKFSRGLEVFCDKYIVESENGYILQKTFSDILYKYLGFKTSRNKIKSYLKKHYGVKDSKRGNNRVWTNISFVDDKLNNVKIDTSVNNKKTKKIIDNDDVFDEIDSIGE